MSCKRHGHPALHYIAATGDTPTQLRCASVPETDAPAAPSGATDEWLSGVDIPTDGKIAIAIACSWPLLETTFLFILLSPLDESGGNAGCVFCMRHAAGLHKVTGIYRIFSMCRPIKDSLMPCSRTLRTRGRNTEVNMVFFVDFGMFRSEGSHT
jgi:hypothetical protein